MSRLVSLGTSTEMDLGHVDRAADELRSIRDCIRSEYLQNHQEPWVVAFSGGKDSTLLLQVTWEVIASLPADRRRRRVHVVANDTLVESPLVIRHLRRSIKTIRDAAHNANLPIETRITRPYVDQTFWVNVIGRGYIPPTRNFRWCTDRMKIIPTGRLLESLITRHESAVLLIGTRRSESSARGRNMDKHGVSATNMNPHSSVPACRVFAPLADLSDDDVWLILMQRPPPWGGSHRDLITLYRNAAGGECPLVLSKEDAPSCGTSSPRFGCWTCTVVTKDKSLRGLIDSGHEDSAAFELLFAFREWLIELRENEDNRMSVRRDGQRRARADGSFVKGPFRMEIRHLILKRLQALAREIGQELISASEIEVIRDIWRRDMISERGRQAFLRQLEPKIAADDS